MQRPFIAKTGKRRQLAGLDGGAQCVGARPVRKQDDDGHVEKLVSRHGEHGIR